MAQSKRHCNQAARHQCVIQEQDRMEEAECQGREDNKSKRKERTTLEKVVLELEAASALPRPDHFEGTSP